MTDVVLSSFVLGNHRSPRAFELAVQYNLRRPIIPPGRALEAVVREDVLKLMKLIHSQEAPLSHNSLDQ